MPGSTLIENYEPDDDDWSVALGPFIRPPVKDDIDTSTDSSPEDEDA